jgi:predicted ArsR family transcriptional regulator
VEHVGTLPATRKPNFAYELTPAGHQFFPKVHGALLNEFLTAIRNQKGRTGLEKLIRQVGSGLMDKLFPGIRTVPPEARILRVLEALKTSGLLAGVEHGRDYLVVRGCSCPVSEVVGAHPELCGIAAKLLTKTLGREVKDRCDRSFSPRCVFQIAAQPHTKK